MSLSHQNRWLRDQDRRDGAGRMGAGWRWRAQEPHPGGCARYDPGRVEMARTGAAHLASPRTLPRHHADPDQSEGLPGEKGSLWGSGVDQVQEGARRAGPRGRRRVGRDRRTEGGEEGAEDGDASCLNKATAFVRPERKEAPDAGRQFLDDVVRMMRTWPLEVAVRTEASNRLVPR